MKLSAEEKDFLKAWAALFKMPLNITVVRLENDYIHVGTSYFWFYNKFHGLEKNKEYKLQELLK